MTSVTSQTAARHVLVVTPRSSVGTSLRSSCWMGANVREGEHKPFAVPNLLRYLSVSGEASTTVAIALLAATVAKLRLVLFVLAARSLAGRAPAVSRLLRLSHGPTVHGQTFVLMTTHVVQATQPL